MNDKIKAGEWLRALPMRAESKRRVAVSTYREVTELAKLAAEAAGESPDLWRDLANWVDAKIEASLTF